MHTTEKIAVVGANGFIGSRLVESLHLSGFATVVPVVRSVGGLARLARFDLDWKLADARDPSSLAKAFSGCEAVVHVVVGDPAVISATAHALIPAAVRAGISRVVYLSTASVHGQAPAAGTTENSPLSDRQDYPYNNAKVKAERRLFADAERTSVEFIALRPCIVFGPRDQWISKLAAELQSDTAWLVDGGGGFCNSVYVDNLIHAIRLSLNAPATAAGHAYLITDDEPVTWLHLYERTRSLIGANHATIHHPPTPQFSASRWQANLAALQSTALAQGIKATAPASLKRVIKASLKAWPQPIPSSPWSSPANCLLPQLDRERVRLQQCEWRFPCDQAKRMLGYAPVVSFEQGLQSTVAWLRWAGLIGKSDNP